MAIAFVQTAGSAFGNNVSHLSETLASNVADGHMLLAFLGNAKGSQIVVTPPSGWPSSPDLSEAPGASSSQAQLSVNHRTAASDGSATYTWNVAPNANLAGAVAEYSGVDATTPLDVAPSGASGTFTAPSITTVTDGCVLVYVMVTMSTSAPTAPSGFTQRLSITSTSGSSDPHVYVFDSTQATHGATGTIAASGTGATAGDCILLALRPASGGALSGTTSSTLALTTSTSGHKVGKGTASPSLSLVTSTAGEKVGKGTVSPTVAFTLTLSGRKRASGTTSSTLSLTGSASGARFIPVSGTTSSTLALTLTLAGHKVGKGTVSPTLRLALSAGGTGTLESTQAPTSNIAGWPLTASQIACLQANSLVVDCGLELLDSSDNLVSDISTDLVPAGSEVDRDNYATIHGTCKLNLSRALQWGAARVRPYMLLTGAGVTVRWNLGVYILTTPDRPAGETPVTYKDVVGYDKLYLLDQEIGDTATAAASSDVLTTISGFIAASGVGGQVNIDGTAAGKTLASDMVWVLDEQHSPTYLQVINDLAATIGYRGIWADRDGALRLDPYILPANRAPLWAFSADDPYTSLIGIDRTETQDLWPVPNWWRFIQRGLTAAPTEGAGQYTYQTPDADPTSAVSLGYTKRKVLYFDAADQASLEAQGNQQVATDQQVTQTLTLTTAPFPVAWHFDIWSYADAALGDLKVQAASWTLPLDGSDQSHTWEAVA